MTQKNNAPSRTADKFVMRLPDGMRPRVEELAKLEHRSMNSFIIAAVEEKIGRGERQELLLNALQLALKGELRNSDAAQSVDRILEKLKQALPASKVLQ